MSRPNKEFDVVGNIIEVNATTKNEDAWMKISIPSDFAVALTRSMLFGGSNSDRPTISDVKLCWFDPIGETNTRQKRLRDLLQEDILERYDNPEYWEIHEDAAEDDALSLTSDILFRYDNEEYWDRDIVVNFFKGSNSFTRDDIELALKIISKNEMIEFLSEGRLRDGF